MNKRVYRLREAPRPASVVEVGRMQRVYQPNSFIGRQLQTPDEI